MATIATLAINLIGNASSLKSALGSAQRDIKATAQSLQSVGTKMTASVSLPILGVAGAALKGAAEMEQLEVSFTTMLKSADRAKALMADLTTFSASTPFELPEVMSAGKMLLAYGVAAEDVQGTLRQLGDVAAGVGAPLGDIAYLFGTARVSGRLFTADINQFTNRGIPIISALAKTMGVAEGSIKKMVEEGKVGFPQLQAAMDYLTTNGGQFEGLMEAQSQTISGLFSTLKDNIGITLATIGRSIVDNFDLRSKMGDAIAVLGQVKDYIVGLAQTNPELLKMGVLIAGVAAAIGPLLVGLGMAMGAVANLAPAIGVLSGVLGALLSPLGLVAAGLAAAFYFDVGGVRSRFGEVLASVWSFASGAMEAFGNYRAVVLDAGFGSIEAQEAISLFPSSLQGILSFVDSSIGAFQNYRATVLDAGYGSIEAQEAIGLFPAALQPVLGALDGLMGKMPQLKAIGQDTLGALQWIWEGKAANIDWWSDITDGLVNLGVVSQETGDILAESLFNAGVTINDIQTKVSAGWLTIKDTVTVAIQNFSWADFIESLTWENVITTLGDWGAFIAPLAWDGLLTVLDWATFIGQLTWDNAVVPALDWAAYVAPLAWDAIVTTLSDWGAYISALDWTAIITTVIDWATWIPALSWLTFITVLEWGAYLVAISWSAFVSVLDWATATGEGITWTDFVNALDWAVYIASFAWDSFVTKLEWLGVIAKLEGWASYIPTLTWSDVITVLSDWGAYLQPIAWDTLVTVLDWAAYVAPLAWDAIVATLSDWGAYITALDWTTIITTVIDWATWIPALTWNAFVKVLEWSVIIGYFAWSSYISKLDWNTAVSTLTWENFVTALKDWSAFIVKLASWTAFISAFAWESFVSKLDWPFFVPKLSWPNISWPGWKAFIPSIQMPTIPEFPGWSWFFGGGGGATTGPQKALGTSYWQGGGTWVGETGREWVTLPRGSQINSHTDSMAMAGAGGGPAVVIQNAVVRDERDIYDLAYRVDELRRRQRRRR